MDYISVLPHINAKWNKLILMKYSFSCETREPDDTQKHYLWMNLWSKFMFAIRSWRRTFQVLHESAKRTWEYSHTQLGIIVYVYISVSVVVHVCEYMRASAFMYNFSTICVTDMQFGSGFLWSCRYNVAFLSPSGWIKVFQSNVMLCC